jgi:hypothetical protein
MLVITAGAASAKNFGTPPPPPSGGFASEKECKDYYKGFDFNKEFCKQP